LRVYPVEFSEFGAGTYIIQVKAEGRTDSRRIVLVK